MPDAQARLREVATALIVATLFAILHTAAFPFAFVGGRVLGMSEAAYLFLAPLAWWLMRKRSIRATLLLSLGASWLSWTVLLIWLRHVTLFGTIGLALVMSLFTALWALGARLVLPNLQKRPALQRIGILAALAGMWVICEWLRGVAFTGFPWLPLAASQWDRPALLQILPFTGWSGLSWLLAYFNLALASYVITIIHPRRDLNWWRRLNPELYSALLLLAGSVASVLTVVHGHAEPEKLFNAGLIQPYVPGTLKWDAELANDNIQRLEALSNFAAIQEADVVFWPESATPWPVISPNPSTQLWVEDLARRKNVSIVMGNFAQIMDADKGEQYFNGVFVVDPQNGLSSNWYAKRKLVPFGEYDPLGPITKLFFEWPTAFFTSGRALADKAPLLRLKLDGQESLSIGALLCYEDIFPALARKEVKEGADFLFVATNNAWYGEEAGAYQHALHSILRAVENRRPVLRCGNGGWSGMIDEYGAIRYIATRPEMGVYFEGEDVFEMVRSPDWKGKFSFYTRHGDWFVILCALAAGIALWFARKRPLDEESGTDLEEDEQGEARRKAHELLRRGKLRFGRRTGRF